MKNLIKEIEELKDKGGWTNDSFYHCAINDAIRTLIQHNIITAPKSIMLSEIISNLRFQIKDKNIYFNKKINCIGYGKFDVNCMQNATWLTLVEFEKDLTIKNINILLNKNIKWLYTLWIAGTEIIDDLEG